MRVTTKGQVTIPEEIRDRLGIGPGSEVEFLATEDGVRFVAVSENISEEERFP
jgi:AbrB family looped-hinge helix DNA binding protein